MKAPSEDHDRGSKAQTNEACNAAPAGEPPSVSLVVVESSIPVSGIARMHSHALKQLGIQDGDYTTITSPKTTILVKAYGDLFIEQREISLRPSERRKLAVMEGDEIEARPYFRSIGVLRRRWRKLVGKDREPEPPAKVDLWRKMLQQAGVTDQMAASREDDR